MDTLTADALSGHRIYPKHPALADGTAMALVLATALIDINLDDAYNAWSVTTFGELARWAVLLIFTAVLWVSSQLLAAPRQLIVRRVILIVALLMVAHWLIGPAVYKALPGKLWGISVLGGLALVLCVWGVRASERRWQLFRSAAVAIPLVFVGSQFPLGSLLAKNVVWPARFVPEDGVRDSHRVATLMLLLDEMNASAAPPLVDHLRSHGLDVTWKSVKSIGHDTIDAVPAMFLGHSFPDAHTCGTETVCSDASALDFGHVRASRPDMDVVGFYHPYCAIRGLRYCSRHGLERPLIDAVGLRCALGRRIRGNLGVTPDECQSKAHEPWSKMANRMLSDLERAPALSQGGVLFAHLPLPHPPAAHNGPLSEQYASNLARVTGVIARLLERIQAAGLEPRIIVFSDHPLRHERWCRTQSHHFDAPCTAEPHLRDDKVPLIVAGRSVPDISSIETNRDVFDLASSWPAKTKSNGSH